VIGPVDYKRHHGDRERCGLAPFLATATAITLGALLLTGGALLYLHLKGY
jgi:hypothetical protein